MKKIANSAQTQIQQIRLIKNNKRELIIIATILAAMLVFWFLLGGNSDVAADISNIINSYHYSEYTYYYTKYSLSFLRSFAILYLCFIAVMMTNSKRLAYGLSTFLVVSMGMDLMSIMSTDLYYMIKPFRYTNYYNFKDTYFAYEIFCLLYSCFRIVSNAIRQSAYRFFNSHNDVCCSSAIENILAHRKKKI